LRAISTNSSTGEDAAGTFVIQMLRVNSVAGLTTWRSAANAPE
jgi:hypothetical protein